MALQQPQLPKVDPDVDSMTIYGSEVDEIESSEAEEEIDELDDTGSSEVLIWNVSLFSLSSFTLLTIFL
jgi:hypothetical protein